MNGNGSTLLLFRAMMWLTRWPVTPRPQNGKGFSFTAQSKITHKNLKTLADKPGAQVIS